MAHASMRIIRRVRNPLRRDMFIVRMKGAAGSVIERFESLDELQYNLRRTAAPDYEEAVMAWARGTSPKFSIRNGPTEVNVWEREVSE